MAPLVFLIKICFIFLRSNINNLEINELLQVYQTMTKGY